MYNFLRTNRKNRMIITMYFINSITCGKNANIRVSLLLRFRKLLKKMYHPVSIYSVFNEFLRRAALRSRNGALSLSENTAICS